MTEPVYNLVFRGEVLEGQDRSAVARRLMALLKMDVARVKALFSGQPVVLKRNVPKAVAARFQAAFRDAGARLRVAPAEAGTPPAAGAEPTPAAKQPPAAKQTLAQRLAAEEAAASSEQPEASGASAGATAGDPSAAPGRPIQRTVAANLSAGDDWTLAAQGGDLVSEDELPRAEPLAVDVSHLSAAPANSGSLEDVLPPAPPPPPAPDTSDLELDETGADLAPAPARDVPELELDLSALTLAETGADLGEGIETGLPLPVPEPDFDLAPAGADIETLPRKPPPPAPDTSYLEVQ